MFIIEPLSNSDIVDWLLVETANYQRDVNRLLSDAEELAEQVARVSAGLLPQQIKLFEVAE